MGYIVELHVYSTGTRSMLSYMYHNLDNHVYICIVKGNPEVIMYVLVICYNALPLNLHIRICGLPHKGWEEQHWSFSPKCVIAWPQVVDGCVFTNVNINQ